LFKTLSTVPFSAKVEGLMIKITKHSMLCLYHQSVCQCQRFCSVVLTM